MRYATYSAIFSASSFLSVVIGARNRSFNISDYKTNGSSLRDYLPSNHLITNTICFF